MSKGEKRFWHILTGEYPPQSGGVSDYTHQVAAALAAAGDEVHVWAPLGRSSPPESDGTADSVRIHRIPDHFGPRGLHLLEAYLRQAGSGRILVQYVPHAFGYRAMNVLFSRWVRRMALGGAAVDIMFHEVAYPLEPGQPLKHKVLALTNQKMAAWLCEGAERIFISVPRWRGMLGEFGIEKAMQWTPVPSNITLQVDPAEVAMIRARIGGGTVFGHFGTYGSISVRLLRDVFVPLVERSDQRRLLLLGQASDTFAAALCKDHPGLVGRVHATGSLEPSMLATHLAASDLVVQPYVDGISCRRGSAMAAIALGLPVVSCIGKSTEPLWAESGAVALAQDTDPTTIVKVAESVLDDNMNLQTLRVKAATLYQNKFDLKFTINALRGITPS